MTSDVYERIYAAVSHLSLLLQNKARELVEVFNQNVCVSFLSSITTYKVAITIGVTGIIPGRNEKQTVTLYQNKLEWVAVYI